MSSVLMVYQHAFIRDQGTNFENTLTTELLKLAGVKKLHTTAYHPMGNGGTERFNQTLGSMLRSLPLKEKHKWPEQIQTLSFLRITPPYTRLLVMHHSS